MTKDKALKLARDWERANIAVREKLAKKHNILPVISRIRGGLKLGIENELQTHPKRIIPGKDEDGNFIFVAKVGGAPKLIRPENLEATLREDTNEDEELNESKDVYHVKIDGESEPIEFPKTRRGLEAAYKRIQHERRPWAILHVDSRGVEKDLVDMSEDAKFKKYADNFFVESKTEQYYARRILETALGAEKAKDIRITKDLIETLSGKTIYEIRKLFDYEL